MPCIPTCSTTGSGARTETRISAPASRTNSPPQKGRAVRQRRQADGAFGAEICGVGICGAVMASSRRP
jgi:hypothetical protein